MDAIANFYQDRSLQRELRYRAAVALAHYRRAANGPRQQRPAMSAEPFIFDWLKKLRNFSILSEPVGDDTLLAAARRTVAAETAGECVTGCASGKPYPR